MQCKVAVEANLKLMPGPLYWFAPKHCVARRVDVIKAEIIHEVLYAM
jgi:hypothetical protein